MVQNYAVHQCTHGLLRRCIKYHSSDAWVSTKWKPTSVPRKWDFSRCSVRPNFVNLVRAWTSVQANAWNTKYDWIIVPYSLIFCLRNFVISAFHCAVCVPSLFLFLRMKVWINCPFHIFLSKYSSWPAT